MRLSRAQIQEIQSLSDEGLSVRAIARKVGLSRSSVHRALSEPLPASKDAWPPPATDTTVWFPRAAFAVDGRQLRVQVRRVLLWGRVVEIDAAGRVLCDGCWRLVSVGELNDLAGGHRPRPPGRGSGMGLLLPAADDDPPTARRRPWVGEALW